MTNIKISQLPSTSSISPNTDIIPVVASGVTSKVTPTSIISATLTTPGTITNAVVGPAASAIVSRFPNAMVIFSETAAGIQKNESHNMGLVSEGVAIVVTTTISGSAGVNTITVGTATGLYVGMIVTGSGIAAGTVTITNIVGVTVTLSDVNSGSVTGSGTFVALGVGVYGVGYTSGAGRCGGVVGEGHVSATGDTGSAIGVRGYANDTHAGGLNIGLYGDAANGATSYSLYLNNGDIYSANAKTWSFAAGGLTINAPFAVSGASSTFTINPSAAGTIDTVNIGATTRGTGEFTTLGANGAVTIATTTNNQAYTTTGAGTITITSGTAGNIDNMIIGDITPAAGKFTTAVATGTGGVGYATGAGGAVTQLTSKATAVTLNKTCGRITLNAASLAAATSVAFTLTNSTIAATDVVVVSIASGGTTLAYITSVESTAAGSCVIQLRNNSAGALAQAVVLNFAVIKAVTA